MAGAPPRTALVPQLKDRERQNWNDREPRQEPGGARFEIFCLRHSKLSVRHGNRLSESDSKTICFDTWTSQAKELTTTTLR